MFNLFNVYCFTLADNIFYALQINCLEKYVYEVESASWVFLLRFSSHFLIAPALKYNLQMWGFSILIRTSRFSADFSYPLQSVLSNF